MLDSRSLKASSTTIALLAFFTFAPTAQSPSTELLVENGSVLAGPLNRLAKQGFRVDAVAIPEGPLVPAHVVTVLTKAGAESAAAEYRVIGDPREWRVTEQINKLAAEGFVLKGVTIASGRSLGTGPSFEAVLERLPGETAARREYRLVRTRGTSADWKLLEEAGRQGFDVDDVIARPDPNQTAAGDVTFICVKRADSVPVTFDLKWAGDAMRIERDVNDLAGKGHSLRVMWTGTSQLSALLSRPVSGATGASSRYEIDADPLTVPSVSSMSGRLVAWLRFKGEQVAAFDRSGRGSYEMVTDPLPDANLRTGSLLDVARGRIDRNVRKGYRPIWARYFRDEKGVLNLSVILAQPSK
jgi:hypothetical protein